jgi:lysophospholipase L1-like esterase
MHKPWHSLVFGISVFATLGLVSFMFPAQGVRIGEDLALKFPGVASLLGKNHSKKDISKVLEAIDAVDTSFVVLDTAGASSVTEQQETKKDTAVKLNADIQYKNKNALVNFFRALSEMKSHRGSIRVLHYGDSQIEGDRITDYLRLKLQGQFGGEGPGLISLMPISPSITNKVINGPGWDRYNVFVAKDKRVSHANYGVLAGFNRYRPYRKLFDTSAASSSSLEVVTTRYGGSNAMAYKKLKLFYGGSQTRTWCEFYDGPALIAADSLESGGEFHVREYEVGRGSNTHRLRFTGKDSPDFYAISLESDHGIMVDNIALRGSSGTFFHLMNIGQLRQFYNYLNVKLIILQFGGNVLPSIRDEAMAINYGNYIRYQIGLVKKAAPEASILFIGPSDMSIKEGTEYVTYPLLEATRDAIKKAVLESNCAFFDMYDCMGGKNSMPGWVDKKLAATDYTHFSPQGARKIATLLYSALIKEYNFYQKSTHEADQ